MRFKIRRTSDSYINFDDLIELITGEEHINGSDE